MVFRKQDGFTLIELMITVAVIAILAAVALPSFQSTLESRQLNGAVDNVYAFISNAKSEAIKKNQTIRFQATVDGTNWCIGIDDDSGADCDCSSNACEVDGVSKNLLSTSFTGITMDNGVNSIDFTPQGIPSAQGTYVLNNSSTTKTVNVNVVGRISVN